MSQSARDEAMLLYEVFAQRFESMAPMVVTSNLDMRKIADALDPRIVDRVKEGLHAVVTLAGPSRRSRDSFFAANKPKLKKERASVW